MSNGTLTALDKRIINVSRDLFLSQGIMKTEMKEIAKLVGVSRSTLYRHFPQTLDIAFYIVEDVLTYLMDSDYDVPSTLNGYERFSLYMHKLLEKMWANLHMVQFINEFDTLYNLKSVVTKAPDQYIQYLTSYEELDMVQIFQAGLADRSIRADLDPRVTPLSVFYAALSMTKHIMLREENYLSEHGLAREFITMSIELMLASIKAD